MELTYRAATAHKCKPVPVIGALALDASNIELRPLTNVSQLPVKVLQGPEVVISQLVLFLVVFLNQREPATQFDSLESTLLHSYKCSLVILLFHVVLLLEAATQLIPCYTVHYRARIFKLAVHKGISAKTFYVLMLLNV
jgi:hypothetical protein